MKKLAIILFALLVFPSTALPQMCEVTIDGYNYCSIEVVDANGVFPAPDVSPSNKGRIYYDFTTDKWKCSENGAAFVNFCSGGGGGSGHTIQDEGSNLTARTNLNFVGAGVTATDDLPNDATVVTIPGGGGGSSCWEEDGNSDLMPVSSTCTDTLWEEDGNSDLQPQA